MRWRPKDAHAGTRTKMTVRALDVKTSAWSERRAPGSSHTSTNSGGQASASHQARDCAHNGPNREANVGVV